MDKDSACLKGADCLILTALTQTPTMMPDPMIGEFCRLVVETLKANGNVLVPCYPSGIIYDLFECLSQQMDMNGLTTIPLFFLSPVADSSLAYSNIMAEWLSTAKHNQVYLPEEPFVHGALQRGGRLKAFPSLEAESVHSEYRQPCVVFCGHPSLRCGDAVHFLQLWGASAANMVIFTEPSFDHQAALAPFQPLAMKTVNCPIDTSLNFTQARKLLRDLRPKLVVAPERYLSPPASAPGRAELVLEADVPIHRHRKLDILQLPVHSSLERLELTGELAARLVPVEVRPGLAVATVTGQLAVKDNKYTLGLVEDGAGEVKVEKRKRESRMTASQEPRFPLARARAQHHLHGGLDHAELVARLAGRGITDAKVEKAGGSVQIHLPHEDCLIQVIRMDDTRLTAVFQVTDSETYVLYEEAEGTAPQRRDQLRQLLRDTILSCIAKY
jgi:integrator complex subunit 9